MKYLISVSTEQGFLWWNGKSFDSQAKAKIYRRQGWALRVIDRLWARGKAAMIQEMQG